MTDELNTARDIARAEKAALWLKLTDELGLFDDFERALIAKWKNVLASDVDARERLWQAVVLLHKIKAAAQSAVNDGKVAAKEVDSIARLGERRKILGVI